jgi:hypothetical protein
MMTTVLEGRPPAGCAPRNVTPDPVLVLGSRGRALEWAHGLASATGTVLRVVHAWRAVDSERPASKGERLHRATNVAVVVPTPGKS